MLKKNGFFWKQWLQRLKVSVLKQELPKINESGCYRLMKINVCFWKHRQPKLNKFVLMPKKREFKEQKLLLNKQKFACNKKLLRKKASNLKLRMPILNVSVLKQRLPKLSAFIWK